MRRGLGKAECSRPVRLRIFSHPEDVHVALFHLLNLAAYGVVFAIWHHPSSAGLNSAASWVTFVIVANLLLAWLSGVNAGVVFHNHVHRRIFRNRTLSLWFSRFWTIVAGWPAYFWEHAHITIHHSRILGPEDWTLPKKRADGSFENIYWYCLISTLTSSPRQHVDWTSPILARVTNRTERRRKRSKGRWRPLLVRDEGMEVAAETGSTTDAPATLEVMQRMIVTLDGLWYANVLAALGQERALEMDVRVFSSQFRIATRVIRERFRLDLESANAKVVIFEQMARLYGHDFQILEGRTQVTMRLHRCAFLENLKKAGRSGTHDCRVLCRAIRQPWFQEIEKRTNGSGTVTLGLPEDEGPCDWTIDHPPPLSV